MSRRGILIVVSGFSGAGKGTLMRELMKRFGCYALSISATTRQPRSGELEGREYFFKTEEEFQEMIRKDQFIEYACYVAHSYGTPGDYVEKQLNSGKDVILEIEIQGALKVKEKRPDTLLMFVTTPSGEELKKRLIGRGTEDMKTIGDRLQRAVLEAEGIENYDYLLVNDNLNDCVTAMHQIIQNEHSKVSRNLSLIKNIREELKGFSKGE